MALLLTRLAAAFTLSLTIALPAHPATAGTVHADTICDYFPSWPGCH
ncbi:MAG: hypothetical protein QM779_13880 [Propionicimonas sp.]